MRLLPEEKSPKVEQSQNGSKNAPANANLNPNSVPGMPDDLSNMERYVTSDYFDARDMGIAQHRSSNSEYDVNGNKRNRLESKSSQELFQQLADAIAIPLPEFTSSAPEMMKTAVENHAVS